MAAELSPAEFTARLTDAVNEVLHADGGRMVNKFVLIAEVLDDSLDRQILVWPSPDVRTWDLMGFLQYASLIADQAELSWLPGGDDEDDDLIDPAGG